MNVGHAGDTRAIDRADSLKEVPFSKRNFRVPRDVKSVVAQFALGIEHDFSFVMFTASLPIRPTIA